MKTQLFTIIYPVLHLPGCDYYNKKEKKKKEHYVIDSKGAFL